MDLKEAAQLAQILQAALTGAAIIVGAAWSYMLFVRKRQKYPRAALTHDISHRPLGDGFMLLSVRAGITNRGEVLLTIVSTEARVQQVLPPPSGLIDQLKGGEDPVPNDRTEMDWPMLKRKLTTPNVGDFQIEPGETDSIQYDFILGDGAQTVEVYTYIKNKIVRKREIGWGVTTIYDIKPERPEEDHNDQRAKPRETTAI